VQSEERKEDSKLPKILLLSTGGTIASKVDYRTGAVTPALSASDLMKQVPELGKIANIDTEVLFSEYSENLQPDHWTKIAEKLDSLANSDYKGILIAHGTDTMHYTSSFLSFALAGFPIPVALVGSQRSSDRPSSDAAINLIAASKFLVESNTKGIFLVMHHNDNDQTVACHAGTRVRKNHTSKRGAFETMGGNPAFIVTPTLEIQKNMQDEFFKDAKYQPRIKIDTKVALVKYHPGYDPKLIENLIQTGCKAIIFEGTGLGHVGRTMYDVVKNAKENDLFLGMTSQCIDGRVRMTVYESGRDLLELGITPLENMTPETSLVKAMWALGNSNNTDELKSLMLENIASEF
jgi:glutamyl-tRNA(Gln) amidotransferase subunit D